jgi:hypothetical protein
MMAGPVKDGESWSFRHCGMNDRFQQDRTFALTAMTGRF